MRSDRADPLRRHVFDGFALVRFRARGFRRWPGAITHARWLRGSQRALDPDRSQRWQPYHAHIGREPLEPAQVYHFDIEVRPYGILMRPGTRLALRIKCADDEKPQTALQAIALGHIARPDTARVTVYHDADHPSHLLLPITRGNRIEMFISGGIPLGP